MPIDIPNAMTIQEGVSTNGQPMLDASAIAPPTPSAMPISPPAADSTTASIRNWRSTRFTLAPIASRIPISSDVRLVDSRVNLHVVQIASNREERGGLQRRRYRLPDVDVPRDDRAVHGRADDRMLESQLGALELRARLLRDSGLSEARRLTERRNAGIAVGGGCQTGALEVRRPIARNRRAGD